MCFICDLNPALRSEYAHTLSYLLCCISNWDRFSIDICANKHSCSFTAGSSGRKFSPQGSSSSGSSNAYLFDTSWESWEGPDRQYLLEAAVEELKQVSVVKVFCVVCNLCFFRVGALSSV